MAFRTANVEWHGTVREGQGNIKLGSGAFEGAYSFNSRVAETPQTNPEELLGAAHAACFTMALSLALTTAGYTPTRINTTAHVPLNAVGGGFVIPRIELKTEALVPGLSAEKFQELAQSAKQNCPLSKALASTPIELTATLVEA